MQVMMLILETPDDFDRRKGPAATAYWDAWNTYAATVADKIVGGNVLEPGSAATTVRVRDGRVQVQDGPFADSKEALGGYVLLEVESMDEALQIASSCPSAATGAVELRPIVPQA